MKYLCWICPIDTGGGRKVQILAIEPGLAFKNKLAGALGLDLFTSTTPGYRGIINLCQLFLVLRLQQPSGMSRTMESTSSVDMSSRKRKDGHHDHFSSVQQAMTL